MNAQSNPKRIKLTSAQLDRVELSELPDRLRKPVPACFDVRKVLTDNAYKARKPRTPRAAYKPKPTMLKHEITAGIGYDKRGFPMSYPTREIITIRERLESEFGGYYELAAMGSYTHASGAIATEESRTWVIVTDRPIEPACEFIRDSLNQESVLLVSTEPKLVKFVKG
jgi:hypothetical protein